MFKKVFFSVVLPLSLALIVCAQLVADGYGALFKKFAAFGFAALAVAVAAFMLGRTARVIVQGRMSDTRPTRSALLRDALKDAALGAPILGAFFLFGLIVPGAMPWSVGAFAICAMVGVIMIADDDTQTCVANGGGSVH